MRKNNAKTMRATAFAAAAAAALLLNACGSINTAMTTAAGNSGMTAGTAAGSTAAAGNMDAGMSAAEDNAAGGSSMTAQAAESTEIKKITPEDAEARFKNGDPVVLVDVRTAEEYKEAHIPGAILIPNEEIGTTRPGLLPVPDAEIIVYCRSGRRSAEAAKKLQALGYTNISDLGGIKDWPYETVAGEFDTSGKEGTLASFRAVDINGVLRDESLFKGHKVTMINIWATFCGPCIDEMPDLGQLSADYKDKGLQIVGIVSDVMPQKSGSFDAHQLLSVRLLTQQLQADYIHLLPSSDLYKAVLGSTSVVPTTYFVDENGKVIGDPVLGSKSREAWSKVFDTVLSEASA